MYSTLFLLSSGVGVLGFTERGDSLSVDFLLWLGNTIRASSGVRKLNLRGSGGRVEFGKRSEGGCSVEYVLVLLSHIMTIGGREIR